MKRNFLFSIILFCAIQSVAQNVGINNPAPQLPLDILKSGGGNIIRLLNPANTTGGTAGILLTNAASNSTPGFNSASIVAQRRTAGGQDLIFSVSQTSGAALERMRIDSFGNVLINEGRIGIGTTTPSYDVYLVKPNASIGFYDEDDNHFSGYINADSTNLYINAYRKSSVGTNVAGDLILQVNSGGFPSFLAGNVGIGTSVPTAKLQVSSNVMIGSGSPATGYLLSVNGKIISEEVRVELDTNWPDYVFEKDYGLIPLPQLENFIRQHKHLPNIPSAVDIKGKGFDLGDMNRRLLEKVEELTLYILEQDKKINALQQQVNSGKQ
jgi:hypothetical protein